MVNTAYPDVDVLDSTGSEIYKDLLIKACMVVSEVLIKKKILFRQYSFNAVDPF